MGWLRGDCLGKVAGRSKHVDFAYWTLFSQLTRSEGSGPSTNGRRQID